MKKRQVTIQTKNNRKRTRGRNYSIVKRKDGKTVKLSNMIIYERELI